MVNEGLLAVVFATVCWWFGTGLTLWLDRQRPGLMRWSLAAASLLLVMSLWAAHESMRQTGAWQDYLGFASVIVMWGWHELAFLSGWLSGPRRSAMTPGARGWQRWREAVAALLWHELALLANFVVLWALQTGQPNHVALCTFSLLWCMRLSAKLNLFWGVPLHGAQYLPPQLTYLASYFRVARPGLGFALSLAGASSVWGWLIWAASTGSVEVSTGWMLLACLLGLGIVEHIVMVLPWPLEKLWGWALHKPLVLAEPQLDPPVVPWQGK